jgi:hypothetical protein
MKQRLNKEYGRYGQRWQAETGYSMIKRCIADTVNGRSYWSQCRELMLIAITYNIMLRYAAAGFLQSKLRPFFCPNDARPHLTGLICSASMYAPPLCSTR